MEQIITKEEVDELVSLKGELRGDAVMTYLDFIFKEEGEEGLMKLERIMREIGYPIKRKEIKRLDFYPAGLSTLFLVCIQRLFNYDDKKFQEMGVFQIKDSLLMRIFMKYFFSIDKTVAEIPKIWRQYLTIGEINNIDLNKDKKFLVLKLENFHLHHISCQIILGILVGSIGMIIKGKAEGKEIKCDHKDKGYHEFLVEW